MSEKNIKHTKLDWEEIKGSFYEQDLQKAKQETFTIEKVLRRYNKNKKALVKCKGYSNKFNFWIRFDDLE